MLEYRVGEGEVFVLGDNSNWSVDSHNWAAGAEEPETARPGGVPLDLIVGRVLFVYLPIERMHKLDPYPLRYLTGTV